MKAVPKGTSNTPRLTAAEQSLLGDLATLLAEMRHDAAEMERIFATPKDREAYCVQARVTEILRYADRLGAILKGMGR